MLNILIVDDEPLVQAGIKSMIEEEKLQVHIMGIVSNGQQAYEFIQENKIDIVITDIKMPILTGLELIEKCNLLYNKPEFIVLTGYEEFKLVQEALKLGAINYLIKLELTKETLEEAICLGIQKVKKNNKVAINHDYISQEVLIERTIRYLLNNKYSEEIVESIDKHIADQLKIGIHGMIYINLCINEERKKSAEIDKRDDLYECIGEIIRQVCNNYFNGVIVPWNKHTYLILLNFEELMGKDKYKNELKIMCQAMVEMIMIYFNIKAEVGISNVYESKEFLLQSYQEAYNALEQNIYTDHLINFFDEMTITDFKLKDINMIKYSKQILALQELGKKDKVKELFNTIVEELKEKGLTCKEYRQVCFSLMYTIKGIFPFNEEKLSIDIININSAHEANLCIYKLGDYVYKHIIEDDEGEVHLIVAKVKKYIDQNYDKKINQNQVAERFLINPSYLSTIFKKYSNEGFAEYVTKVKIQKAQELLLNSHYKIYQISYKLGYDNPYYFSKVFKRIVGMTPKEFVQIESEN